MLRVFAQGKLETFDLLVDFLHRVIDESFPQVLQGGGRGSVQFPELFKRR